MEQQQHINLEDLCRFCLSNKCDSLIALSEKHLNQFQDLTKHEVIYKINKLT